MRRVTRYLTPLAVVLSLSGEGLTALAQDAPIDESQLNLEYNEEVVRNILDESDPDTAFLARLEMMRGHLEAARLTMAAGDPGEAHQHIMHPASEILPEIDETVRAYGLTGLEPAMDAAAAALHSGDPEAIDGAIAAMLEQIDVAESKIDPAKLTAEGILPDAIVVLLRTAVAEYGEAFEYGTIVNLVEYHDGAAFVDAANSMLGQIEPILTARDPGVWAKLKTTMAALGAAWPGVAPPEQSMPLSELLTLVSIVEMQINTLRYSA